MTEDLDVIEQAHAAAKRIEDANKIQMEILKRQEELQRREEGLRLLGGRSAAGETPQPELTEQEKIVLDNRNKFKGTALGAYLK